MFSNARTSDQRDKCPNVVFAHFHGSHGERVVEVAIVVVVVVAAVAVAAVLVVAAVVVAVAVAAILPLLV